VVASFIDPRTRAIFGRSYVAEQDVLIEQPGKEKLSLRLTYCF
jgi:hypothetical protein